MLYSFQIRYRMTAASVADLRGQLKLGAGGFDQLDPSRKLVLIAFVHIFLHANVAVDGFAETLARHRLSRQGQAIPTGEVWRLRAAGRRFS
ncbi:hypothetical protein [Cohnella sp.]|uniref:hypothetical protein n=1 Tax=Cohnella sp. TaxID=1883426 RepID=UPI00370481D6